VRLANFAQLVNAIAPIFTSPQGLFLQTIYHPLRLYAEHTLGTALDVHMDGPTYDLPSDREPEGVGRVHHVAELGPFSLLDAAATCDPATGQLTLTVVNRDRERGHAATIDLGAAAVTGGLEVSEVNGPDVNAMNSFAEPDTVRVHPRRVEVAGATIEYDFPAHSVSVLRMRLR